MMDEVIELLKAKSPEITGHDVELLLSADPDAANFEAVTNSMWNVLHEEIAHLTMIQGLLNDIHDEKRGATDG